MASCILWGSGCAAANGVAVRTSWRGLVEGGLLDLGGSSKLVGGRLGDIGRGVGGIASLVRRCW